MTDSDAAKGEAKTMLDVARVAFQRQGMIRLHGHGCPGDIPKECYEARRFLKTLPADATEQIARLTRERNHASDVANAAAERITKVEADLAAQCKCTAQLESNIRFLNDRLEKAMLERDDERILRKKIEKEQDEAVRGEEPNPTSAP